VEGAGYDFRDSGGVVEERGVGAEEEVVDVEA